MFPSNLAPWKKHFYARLQLQEYTSTVSTNDSFIVCCLPKYNVPVAAHKFSIGLQSRERAHRANNSI